MSEQETVEKTADLALESATADSARANLARLSNSSRISRASLRRSRASLPRATPMSATSSAPRASANSSISPRSTGCASSSTSRKILRPKWPSAPAPSWSLLNSARANSRPKWFARARRHFSSHAHDVDRAGSRKSARRNSRRQLRAGHLQRTRPRHAVDAPFQHDDLPHRRSPGRARHRRTGTQGGEIASCRRRRHRSPAACSARSARSTRPSRRAGSRASDPHELRRVGDRLPRASSTGSVSSTPPETSRPSPPSGASIPRERRR